jgi:hypothetical protein
MRKSHVYFLKHRLLPYWKCGKADVVITRVIQIGIEHFDLESSFAYAVNSPEDARALETIFHLCNRKERIAANAELPKDGATEWFKSGCLNNHNEIIGFTGIATNKIEGVSVNERNLKLRRYIQPSRRTAKTIHYFDSREQGLMISAKLLNSWLGDLTNKYPNMSVQYVADGEFNISGYIQYGGQATQFGDGLLQFTNYSWVLKDADGETTRCHDRFIRKIMRTKSIYDETLTISLAWDSLTDEQLNMPAMRQFNARWQPNLQYRRILSPEISHLAQHRGQPTPEWGWV